MDSMMEENQYTSTWTKVFNQFFFLVCNPYIEIFFSSLTIYLWPFRMHAKKAYELDVKMKKYKTSVETFQKNYDSHGWYV